MAYNKTTWASGDTITAEKMNNIENGLEHFFVVTQDSVNGQLNVSYEDICNVFDKGKIPILVIENNLNNEISICYFLKCYYDYSTGYRVFFDTPNNTFFYAANPWNKLIFTVQPE